MIRRLSRFEVQMLIDLAVELGEVNYTTETPILTDLTSVDWIPTLVNNIYTVNDFDLKGGTLSRKM